MLNTVCIRTGGTWKVNWCGDWSKNSALFAVNTWYALGLRYIWTCLYCLSVFCWVHSPVSTLTIHSPVPLPPLTNSILKFHSAKFISAASTCCFIFLSQIPKCCIKPWMWSLGQLLLLFQLQSWITSCMRPSCRVTFPATHHLTWKFPGTPIAAFSNTNTLHFCCLGLYHLPTPTEWNYAGWELYSLLIKHSDWEICIEQFISFGSSITYLSDMLWFTWCNILSIECK